MDAKTDGRAANEPRVEDDVLVRGHGRYAADAPCRPKLMPILSARRMRFASIVSVDVTAALDAGGVLGVLTAKDMDGVGSLGRHPPLAGRGGKGLIVPHRPALAAERVMHVGEAGRDGRRRERGRSARRRRTGRGRIRTAHAGDRCTRGARGRRAASVAGKRRAISRWTGRGPPPIRKPTRGKSMRFSPRQNSSRALR